jgi:hypothetical protein
MSLLAVFQLGIVQGNFVLRNLAHCTESSFTSLAEIGGNFKITNSPTIATVSASFPQLKTVGGSFFSQWIIY